jgi:hypothetical protein
MAKTQLPSLIAYGSSRMNAPHFEDTWFRYLPNGKVEVEKGSIAEWYYENVLKKLFEQFLVNHYYKREYRHMWE